MPSNRISSEISTAGGSHWKRRPQTYTGFKAETEAGQGRPVAESAAGVHGEGTGFQVRSVGERGKGHIVL